MYPNPRGADDGRDAVSGQPRRPPSDGGLRRVCEPASGSGALLLAWAGTIAEREGIEALRYWSFTAIDLASECARMTAVQLLANAVIQPCVFGELLVYQGNALAASSDLDVVVHAVAPTTPLSTRRRPGWTRSKAPRGWRVSIGSACRSKPKKKRPLEARGLKRRCECRRAPFRPRLAELSFREKLIGAKTTKDQSDVLFIAS